MVDRAKRTPLGKLANTFKTLFHIICCFFLLYLTLIVFSIPLFLLFCYRIVLKTIFSLFYHGRLRLVDCANACYAAEWHANVITIYYFLFIEGPCCDVELLRERLHRMLTSFRDKKGSRPYELMLCSVIQKFGFYCFNNTRNSFDIKHHIRFFPGCSDPNQVYTEADVFEAAGKLADDVWDEDKPHWEILIVPQMKKDVTGEICSTVHFRFSHTYVDGVSLLQLIRHCLSDKPVTKFIFDPVNPPIPSMPLWFKLLTYLQIFFLGPWASIKFVGRDDNHIFCEGPLTGTKFFGRSTLDIPLDSIRRIRKKYGCTTGAIQHYCVTGALSKLADHKGFPLPESILGSLLFAKIPYRNEFPDNRVMFAAGEMPIGSMKHASISERLSEINRNYQNVTDSSNYYGLLASRIFLKTVGLFPAVMLGKMFGNIRLAYAISNVPGQQDVSYFKGNKVLAAFGSPPLFNRIRYTVGVFCYENKLTFCFQSEKSSLIKERSELLELIEEFDNEMKSLMDSTVEK